MHDIEPFYMWRDEYTSEEDRHSPFYGVEYSEFHFSNKIYNYVIHPQWDNFGSSTLFCKILFADYDTHFAVIELIGEWNDAVHNDIMELRKGLIDSLLHAGIHKFLLIGENVLNFHASDDLYYEEWNEEIKDVGGWIVALNFRQHLLLEMRSAGIDNYVFFGEKYNDFLWRKILPAHLMDAVEDLMLKRLG
ncbi:MAG: hypothetical protein IPH78_08045 [Bacteroidetes bacterium]|nr:hypothetical protein [Bacteroidota bacterium]MBK8657773.1 hypothetical protein [Bacteroidota bacterium]